MRWKGGEEGAKEEEGSWREKREKGTRCKEKKGDVKRRRETLREEGRCKEKKIDVKRRKEKEGDEEKGHEEGVRARLLFPYCS